MVDGDFEREFNNFQLPPEERCRGGSITGADFGSLGDNSGDRSDSITDASLKKVEEIRKVGLFKLQGAVKNMMTKAGQITPNTKRRNMEI